MTRRSPPTLVALTVLATLAAPLAADQKADIPVSRVVLYSSGVAYFEHAGQVEGDATLALRFKTDQINDVLKSMVFADADGGTVSSVDYASNDPVERALRSFGIDLSGDPSLPDLLKQLRGAQIVVTAPEEVIGSVLNVQARQVVRGDPPVTLTEHFLTLVTESGIRTLPMDSIERLELTDGGLKDELEQGVGAACRVPRHRAQGAGHPLHRQRQAAGACGLSGRSARMEDQLPPRPDTAEQGNKAVAARMGDRREHVRQRLDQH